MQKYGNAAGDSGVIAYETGVTFIIVKFRNGKTYRYSNAVAGAAHVGRLKELALAGRGLGTYISQNVHDLYDRQ